MRKFLLLSTLWALAASGGEKPLGIIIVTDAGTQSNRTTGYTAYATATAFSIGPQSKISVQCDQDCYVCTDAAGCDAGTGVNLGAGMLLPTSIGTSVCLTGKSYNSDGGTAGNPVTYCGGWLSVAPWNTDGGGTTAVAHVFSRSGLE